MKLLYISLENFALIRTGMGINKIELDFRKASNVVTLIVGNNGTGKTALLSNLHPYASLGHLEARDDSDLIIQGEDGLKKAVFHDGKHEYLVTHYYKWMGIFI